MQAELTQCWALFWTHAFILITFKKNTEITINFTYLFNLFFDTQLLL